MCFFGVKLCTYTMFTLKKSVIVFSVLFCNFIVTFAKTGDRALAECKRHGEVMEECQRILYKSSIRVPADVQAFPHMVLLGYSTKNESEVLWNCGGTLISDFWVLTAAHCIKAQAGPPVQLRFGTSVLDMEEVEDILQERGVAETVVHPEYKPPSKYHDIGLVRIDSPIEIKRDIRIACLPVATPAGLQEAIATGFGRTEIGRSDGSNLLMKVKLQLVSKEKCNATLRHLRRALPRGLQDGQLCAGDLTNGGKDTCQGDSGGPLQFLPQDPDCKTRFPLFVVMALTSFGQVCGMRNSPGVYTNITEYIDWIEGIVWPQQDP